MPCVPRKTTEAHLLTSRKRRVCATFPIGTATSASRGSRTSHTWNVTKCHACNANRQKHTSQHVEKDVFLEFFPIGTATSTLRSVKINVFLRVFLWTDCKIDVSCEASVDFHVTKCHACHGICTLSPPRRADNAIYRKHATRHVQSAAPATENDIGRVQNAARATKNATHLLKM